MSTKLCQRNCSMLSPTRSKNNDKLIFLAVCSSALLYMGVRLTLNHNPSAISAPISMRDLYEPVRSRSSNESHHRGKGDFNVSCTMETCFDFSKCRNGFKVYVYGDGVKRKRSKRFEDILTAVRQSRFFTTNASEACLVILGVDTLDRDKLSADFDKKVGKTIKKLPYWNHGTNHLIFVLYSGTWPNYTANEFSFDFGKALVAQASLSQHAYRSGYDISFPLYNIDHPQKGGATGDLSYNIHTKRKYLMSFKGKRYVYGIGSESRSAMYKIHNGQDVVAVTTCKHKGVPEKLYDDRCAADQVQYNKFLESLKCGCIPILLSNEYVLPFNEVTDWSRAIIWADERRLQQVPEEIRRISSVEILAMRQQIQFLWDTYFSSTRKIVDATLEIIAERVARHFSRNTRNSYVWNRPPGALVSLPEYSSNLSDYPFYMTASHIQNTQVLHNQKVQPPVNSSVESSKFTAIILTKQQPSENIFPANKLIANLAKSQYLHQIIVLWQGQDSSTDKDSKYMFQSDIGIPVKVIKIQNANERFFPFADIKTHAILSLDDTITLSGEQADFGFLTWSHFPERLAGYQSRSHYWNETRTEFVYSSRISTSYSMILASSAFYHKYYSFAFFNLLNKDILDISNRYNGCEDILINVLISTIVQLPPIRILSQHKGLDDSLSNDSSDICQTETLSTVGKSDNVDICSRMKEDDTKYHARRTCLVELVKRFGYMPLKKSEIRLDPQLYHDNVSVTRKKYRTIEVLPMVFSQ